MGEEEFQQLGLDQPSGVILGQRKNGQLIRFDGDGHIMVFAPSGAGKGIGFVQPNLVEYRGSMVVIDPKGENAITSAAYRRQKLGQETIILDPFGLTKMHGQTYNPLSALTYADSSVIGPWIECLAEAMIKDEGAKDQHWVQGARKFSVMLMWWMVAHEPPERRNLGRLFELVNSGYELLAKMATVMSEGRSPDPEVARLCRALGSWFLGRQEKEFSYFESICINQLGWLGDFVWKDVLSGRPTPPLQLKIKPTTIYLVLPFHRLGRYQSWLRLMVADLLTNLYDTQGMPKNGPVLFMLDEASAGLGRMDFLFDAAAAVRGAGARLAFVYQDISQVAKHYGDAWQSLVSNAGVTMFWSVNDPKAAQFISSITGTKTTPVFGNPAGIPEPLIRSEAILKMPVDEIIAKFRNASPAKFGRLNGLTDTRFNSKLAKNTTYGEAVERSSAARTDFVPVDLSSVGAPPRQFEEDDEPEDVQTRNHLEEIASVTGLPMKLLETLEAQNGRLLLKGDNLGYLDERGVFQGLISKGG